MTILKLAGRTVGMIAGIIGALFNLVLNAAHSGIARMFDYATGGSTAGLHGGWGLILGLVGLLGAIIALPFPEVAAILMLISGVGMFFVIPWYLALVGSILLIVGAGLAWIDRKSKKTAAA